MKISLIKPKGSVDLYVSDDTMAERTGFDATVHPLQGPSDVQPLRVHPCGFPCLVHHLS